LNRGNSYPFILHACPQFNAPLVQLVHCLLDAHKSPLAFVDVGAAAGDTVLLVKERCPGAIDRFICIEGDAEFYALLIENMRQFDNITIVKSLLARESKQIRSLVKHHEGTATAIGDEMVDAVCLDSIDAVQNAQIHILKIDVDGFDGEVLDGATNTLLRCQPAVIFEWHPKLIVAAGTDPFRAFDALGKCGYARYLWFKNNGTFSHFSDNCSREVLERELRYLLRVNSRLDEHFDIVALPHGSKIDEIELAALEFGRAASRGDGHRRAIALE